MSKLAISASNKKVPGSNDPGTTKLILSRGTTHVRTLVPLAGSC